MNNRSTQWLKITVIYSHTSVGWLGLGWGNSTQLPVFLILLLRASLGIFSWWWPLHKMPSRNMRGVLRCRLRTGNYLFDLILLARAHHMAWLKVKGWRNIICFLGGRSFRSCMAKSLNTEKCKELGPLMHSPASRNRFPSCHRSGSSWVVRSHGLYPIIMNTIV